MIETEQIREAVREEIKPLREQLAKLDTFLTGGEKPETGVLIRLDRIEQREKARSRLLWLVVGLVATIIVERVRNLLVRGA